jgi:hypothetical protein
MTSPKLKTFCVRFCVTDWYWIDVEADSKLSAITQAHELYGEHGEDPTVGFAFDINRGGEDGWEAEEVVP